MGMILPAWFDHLEESFSYKKGHLKKCCPPAKNVNETPRGGGRGHGVGRLLDFSSSH